MIFGIKAVKCLLFIFNFIFAIFGIVILALGIVYKLQIESIIQYLGNDFPIAPDLFIAIGTVAFIISFFGCIGASRENRPMLIAFVILLVILLVIELAVVIIAFVEVSNGNLEKNISNLMEREKDKGTLGKVEVKLECCGIIGPLQTYTNFTMLPDTCFKNLEKIEVNLFKYGCLSKVKDLFHSTGIQLGAIAIAVSIIEIIGSLFALTLSSIVKNNRS